ncbi:MAG: hypothetical protein F4X56_05895 [Gammaproteobacteria bacterium]|nr:hypothetical protein [Gammaproteobacteria bacterium]
MGNRTKGPGQSQRKGLTVFELLTLIPDEATAERFFEDMLCCGVIRGIADIAVHWIRFALKRGDR